MTNAFVMVEDAAVFVRGGRRSRGLVAPALTGAAALTASVVIGGWLLSTQPGRLDMAAALPPGPAPSTAAPAHRYGALLDPSILGLPPVRLSEVAPLQSAFEGPAPTPPTASVTVAAVAPATPATPAAPAAPPLAVTVADATPEAPPVLAEPAAPSPASVAEVSVPLPPEHPLAAVEDVPLPLRRPTALLAQMQAAETPAASAQAPAPTRAAARATMRQRSVVAAAAPVDNRSFFEKIFGAPAQPAGPGLAYAAAEDGFFHDVQRSAPSAVMPAPRDRAVAVYDISAHTVTLPDGTRLEAHSGLGSRLDDPRRVSERNVGPTPPATYDLTLREQLFHGVAALRLTPVGGGGVFGRNGLLAHTFMLGPNGDSNGCVSFRDYNAFLQAFRRGAVRQLVVVARAS